jgi:hypothetical protein
MTTWWVRKKKKVDSATFHKGVCQGTEGHRLSRPAVMPNMVIEVGGGSQNGQNGGSRVLLARRLRWH